MKLPILLIFVFLMPCFVVVAQQPVNALFNDISTRPCPYDSTAMVTWPDGWQIYQTLNGEWDGTVDSSRCIHLEAIGNNARLYLDDMDTQLPIFIRTDAFTQAGTVASLDRVYLAFANLTNSEEAFFSTNTFCPGGLCTGLITQTSVYNENTDERVFRTYSESIGLNNQFYSLESCIPIERFEDQRFETFIIKLTFNVSPPPSPQGQYVEFINLGFDYFTPTFTFDTLVFAEQDFNGIAYENTLKNIVGSNFYPSTFMGLYNQPTFPSPSNVAYIEASLPESINTPQAINLVIQEESSLFLQPFTQLRGALVANSDSLRHELNIINNGNDWCISDLVELVFNGNGNFEYRSGHIDFGGTTSCLMFRNGSELRVDDQSVFRYGDNGEGILGLHYGGKIVLGEQSALHINNRVALWNDPNALSPEEAIVTLSPGQRLVFGPHSRIEPKAGGSYFTVFMNGGTLDDSALHPDSRARIKRIYPEPPAKLEDNINIYPNPVGETLQWRYIATGVETLNWRWQNAAGQVLRQGRATATKGVNTLQQACDLPTGVYFLQVRTADGQATVPFVKS